LIKNDTTINIKAIFANKMPLLTPDYTRYLLSLLVCIPLSYIQRFIGDASKFRWAKHVYNIICCIAITEYLYFRGSILVSMIPLILLWYSQRYVVSKQLQKRKRLWILCGVWVTSMLYLSVFQINRMLSYWLLPTIDVTTTQMMVTVRMTQFATKVYQGQYDNRYPSLIEFLGFNYYVPSFMVGPIITLKEYRDWIDSSESDSVELSSEDMKQLVFLSYKSAIFFALTSFGIVFFDPFISVNGSTIFNISPLVFKLVFLYISIGLVRFKYYFAWSLAEIKFIISGMWKYTSHKGRNIDIPAIETAGSPHQLLNAWNISVNLWLKNCVYKVLLGLDIARGYAIISTNIVSALWHGFYPGYYLAFIGGGMATILHQKWRNVTTFSKSNNVYYERISRVFMSLLLIFVGGPFVLCDFWYSLDYYTTLNLYGFVMLGFGAIAVYVLDKKSKSN
jgi:lysophospholipid acyltransferase